MTIDPVALLQSQLADALAARHRLLIGQQAVSVSSGGKSVSYTAATLAQLDTYIASLRTQLGVSSGIGRPITPIFG